MPPKSYGIALVITATLLFAIHDGTTKYLLSFFAVPLLIWARYFVTVVFVLAWEAPRTGRELIVTSRPALMIVRALTLVGVALFFQNALKSLPLPEATALAFMSPMIVTLLAGPMLGEKVRFKAWLSTIGGFCGVLLIARPGGEISGVGVILALASAFCFAIYQILTRKLAETEPAMRLLIYTALVGVVAMSFLVPAHWFSAWPSPLHTLLIVSLGFTASVGHFLLIRAYHVTPASTIAPLLYLPIVWAMLIGLVVFRHLPDPLTLAGMLTIGLSCLSLVWRRRAPAESF